MKLGVKKSERAGSGQFQPRPCDWVGDFEILGVQIHAPGCSGIVG